MSRSDAELLAEASRGEQSAFTTLYRRYESDLYRFAVYLTDGPETAEELFQETWVRVVKHLGKKPIADFKKWMFTIATNLYRDEIRKRKIRRLVFRKESIDELETDTADERGQSTPTGVQPSSDDLAIRDALDIAMRELTHRQRTVFVLTYVEGYKIREVSKMLGKAEGTIKSTLYRSIEILRTKLKDFREYG